MSERLAFSKYQGTGNDFVMVVDLDDERPLGPELVAALCDRRTGIGADGVIRVVRATEGSARLFMDYANADGSVAEMCGNGIRCVGVLARERGLVDELAFDVATRAGVKHLELATDDRGAVRSVTVGMGPANFTLASIPMRGPAWETFLGQPFEIGQDLTLTASAVSMGNPHLVLFVDEDPARYHVGHIGPALERHERFPEGTNVEFAHVDGDRIVVRVWERGSGETLACGSGACAVAVAANEAGLAPSRVTIRFPGGDVEVERREGGEVCLTGPASHVFDGTVDLGGLGARMTEDLGRRLAARTLELVDLPSESGDEASILARLRGLVPPSRFTVADDGDAVLLFVPRARRPEAPLVLLAGHVDTVPAAGNVPGRLDGGTVVGRGACDMKGALAVILEIADDAAALDATDLDVGLLFVGREELPITESALMPLLERSPAILEADLALVMEPTANGLEIGCMGNLNATIRAAGRAAHTARPWLGENAIHAAILALAPLVDLPIRDVEIDGLVFREVVSVTRIEGGGARNVIPDRVEAQVNLRYAPNHTPSGAEERLRELLGPHPVEIEIVGNAPPGPVTVGNPLVGRLRDAGNLEVGPKQAWTPVAEFAAAGIDAVNLGPGDPQYAHRDDERVEVAALVKSTEIVRAFLAGTGPAAEDA